MLEVQKDPPLARLGHTGFDDRLRDPLPVGLEGEMELLPGRVLGAKALNSETSR